MADNVPVPRISDEDMQRIFNEGRYWERMQAGEFEEKVISYHPESIYPEVMERHPGAKSVTTHYLDKEGNLVAELHYFRMPDGSVIPNKRPDPKILRVNGVLYRREKQKARLKRLAEDASRTADLSTMTELGTGENELPTSAMALTHDKTHTDG
jgi:hypothetical protein